MVIVIVIVILIVIAIGIVIIRVVVVVVVVVVVGGAPPTNYVSQIAHAETMSKLKNIGFHGMPKGFVLS